MYDLLFINKLKSKIVINKLLGGKSLMKGFYSFHKYFCVNY